MTVMRQANLFAAEDWKIAYDAYSQIDFQAYDFDTIRLALVEYIQTNFPENFNDYLESSEFIAIIELLAYLSQSLAFRMDVNTRENFLETAERKDSVFKLARMLGYNPKRNIPASGIMKVVSVQTSENINDSLGNQLSNRPIFWDDANNSQSYEQFLLIMNAAMSSTNRFSAPIKQGTIGGIDTELYQINTPIGSPIAYNFNMTQDGKTRPFNMVNPDFVDDSHFYERHPDTTNLFNIIYRNDGKGLSSKDTGFFTMFRQGALQFADFNYTAPLQNRQEDVLVANINENDVYLQKIDNTGLVLDKWEKVPNTVGQTLNYNNKTLDTRSLYAIENLGDTGIRLKFADGNFADVPIGQYRLWYRSSDPTRYTIQPNQARNIAINIPYIDTTGRNQTLSLTVSLQYAVSNSLPAESVAAIKQRAPQVFYTQNRMVSAQDYNVFPQSQSGNITKIKATNKTHAGHSRYIDLNDPTGSYQNVDTFANDAYLYADDIVSSEQIIVDSNTTAQEVTLSILPDQLKKQAINNFVYYGVRDIWLDPLQNGSISMFSYSIEDLIQWNTAPIRSESATGYFTEYFTTGQRNVLINVLPETKRFKQNTFLKFVNPENNTEFKWVRIVDVQNGGQLTAGVNTASGPFTLSEVVPNNWYVSDTIVSLRKLFTATEAVLIEAEILNRRTFAIGYHLTDDRWYVIPGSQLSSANKTGSYAIDSSQEGSNSWLMLMEYQPIDQFSYRYILSTRGQDYVIQSKSDLKFYNVKNVKVIDSTNKSSQDLILHSVVNTKPNIEETFEWSGVAWRNTSLNTLHYPFGLRTNIPLTTRDTTWQDIDVAWQSNFGILELAGNGLADYAVNNQFVNPTRVELNTYKQVTSLNSSANVIVQDNQGAITAMPQEITIPFNDVTFGSIIVDRTETTSFIAYKQIPPNGVNNSDELIFKAPLGGTPVSWGVSGTVEDTSIEGRLYFTEYNEDTGEGTLVYKEIQDHDLFRCQNAEGVFSADSVIVQYRNNKEKLDRPIKWEIADIYKEPDGYVDSRKVRVAPIDLDDDMVPDYPTQFSDYVGKNDLVLFEYYTDFDGYIYDRPVEGVILDYRTEDMINIQNGNDRISRGSYTEYTTLSTVDWILVKTKAIAQTLAGTNTNASGIVVYVQDENKVYQLLPESTNLNRIALIETTNFFVKKGRGQTQNTDAPEIEKSTIRWQHVAPSDVRIDPSISNVVEMVVLTTSYYDEVKKWQNNYTGDFPLAPTSNELGMEFAGLNSYKAASDTLVYRSAKFKLLFGAQADTEYRAQFRVVKLSNQISDNELKTRIISIINEYFNVNNWEFGETFYFTELSSYIHQRLGSNIGSIVILPKTTNGVFGELFQVKAEPNELFISTASVNDIELVSRLDNQTLRTSSSATTSTTATLQYTGADNNTGPYAIAGYYPLYSNAQIAQQAGNGTYHEHTFFGQKFYMPNGVPFYHGTYTATEAETNITTVQPVVVNNGDSY